MGKGGEDESITAASNFRTNQVVWAQKEDDSSWYPGVIIDSQFYSDLAEKPEAREGFERIFWLGYSSTGLVPRAAVKDFCVGFQDCYRNATSDARTLESVKVAVQLAAVRAQELLEDPANDWLQWGLTNLGKFEELILSDTFYQSLGRKPATKPGTDHLARPSATAAAAQRVGSLVWISESGSSWPAVVVRTEADKLDVVVVSGAVLRRKTVARDSVRNFCAHFGTAFPEPSAQDRENEPERFASVKRVVAVVSNQSEGEMGEGTEWESWARDNIHRYRDFCLSQDDVRDILKNTSRTASKLGKAKRGAASATASVQEGDPVLDLYIEGVDNVGGALAAPKAKAPRHSFGSRKRVEFTDEERVLLAVPLADGWRRILAKRREPSKKFGDVYYVPPVGKRLRSMKELNDYLVSNSDKCADLSVKNFCFTDVPLNHPKEDITEPKS